MKNLGSDEKAFHPVISAVILFTLVALVLGIVVMVYAPIQQSTLEGTFRTSTNTTFNDTSAQATVTWLYLGNTIASSNDATAYSISVVNSTSVTLTQGQDYNVTVANSTVSIKASAAQKNKTMAITYSYEPTASATQRTLATNQYSGFSLGALTPIVLAAGLIISVIIGFAYGLRGKD